MTKEIDFPKVVMVVRSPVDPATAIITFDRVLTDDEVIILEEMVEQEISENRFER